MRVFLFFLIIGFNCYGQNSYKTESGIVFKVGDTLQIGQPLSHLGWVTIYSDEKRETYITNKNMINQEVIIKSIDTINNPVNFTFSYLRKDFRININEALKNKEIIPQFERALAKNGVDKNQLSKYELLKQLKELLDMEAITKEEFEIEKKKILGN